MNVFKKVFFMFFELGMQPRFVTVDKIAGIFTKRIWQP